MCIGQCNVHLQRVSSRDVQGMTLTASTFSFWTGSFLHRCVMRPASQRFFIHRCIYLRLLIISYLAKFLGTNSLSVLMCRKAVNQSIVDVDWWIVFCPLAVVWCSVVYRYIQSPRLHSVWVKYQTFQEASQNLPVYIVILILLFISSFVATWNVRRSIL